jgi:GNAT superfamily N-acetyltransferase
MTPTIRERFTAMRVAHPATDLARSTRFYRGLLGLTVRGRFDGHDGYDGVFFTLPGGGELELTAGPGPATSGTDDDLLVLYTGDVAAATARLDAAGASSVQSPNPYWNRYGRTYLDPDGYRIVIAARDRYSAGSGIDIAWHCGPRAALRPLFELAEDSPIQLAQYLALGRVLVAQRDDDVLGHLQLVSSREADEIELKSMAVFPDYQLAGIGRALVTAAVDACRAEGWSRMVVATAAADIGNLRFYQRMGFRFRAVDRDAFTSAHGYPDAIVVDAIPLRDRVWLDLELVARTAA